MSESSVSATALDESTLILDRCDQLASHSQSDEHLERVHLTTEHAAVNALAASWMREAGLVTWQDAAGNQCGRLEGSTPGLPALLLGSHLDTVSNAGRYDGTLGVVLAIAVVSRIARSRRPLPFALEVVAFGDEEGTRFGTALLGSRALAGDWNDDWASLTDRDGLTLHEAFLDFGLDPAKVPDAARKPGELVGYLEAHIEQGPLLEDAGRALGVVSSIAGARRSIVTITGHAGHAGGTPFDRRRDALVGASEAVLAIERLSRDGGVIGTVGKLDVFPGGVNVIPGRVEFSLDIRAEFDADRDRVLAQIQQALIEITTRRSLEFSTTEIYRADAVECSGALQRAIERGIRTTGDERPVTLYSKAGHDAMAVASVTDVAMLFIRCAGGVSHHPDESVTAPDVAAALDAFENAVLEVAGE